MIKIETIDNRQMTINGYHIKYKEVAEEILRKVETYNDNINSIEIFDACIVNIKNDKSAKRTNKSLNLDFDIHNGIDVNYDNICEILAAYGNSLSKKAEDIPDTVDLVTKNCMVYMHDDPNTNCPVIYVNKSKDSKRANLAIYLRFKEGATT